LGVWVRGVWRSGKTEFLKKIGRDYYKNTYCVDLCVAAQRERLEQLYYQASVNSAGVSMDYDKRFVKPMFEQYFKEMNDADFIDSADSLLIIEEIQESDELHDAIRKLVRGLDAKIAFTSNCHGKIKAREHQVFPHGDTQSLELGAVSYLEFLRQAKVYPEYSAIKKIVLDKSDSDCIRIFNEVKGLWNDYKAIGGYPEVVSEYLNGMSAKSCSERSYAIITESIAVMAEKAGLAGYTEEFRSALAAIFDCVISGLLNPGEEIPINEYMSKRCNRSPDGLRVNDCTYGEIFGWLIRSGVLTPHPVVLGSDGCRVIKYMFADLGWLRYAVCSLLDKRPDLNCAELTLRNFVPQYLALTIKGLEKERLREPEDYENFTGMRSYGWKDQESSEKVAYAIHTYTDKKIIVDFASPASIAGSSENPVFIGKADYAIGKANYAIHLTDELGSWEAGSNAVSIPIYAIDKLPIVIQRMALGEFEEKGPNEEGVS
jgi:hypothetical protein